jgi:hypothetical protein
MRGGKYKSVINKLNYKHLLINTMTSFKPPLLQGLLNYLHQKRTCIVRIRTLATILFYLKH